MHDVLGCHTFIPLGPKFLWYIALLLSTFDQRINFPSPKYPHVQISAILGEFMGLVEFLISRACPWKFKLDLGLSPSTHVALSAKSKAIYN